MESLYVSKIEPVPDVNENFIDLFINHFLEYESPTSFWKWAAYGTIGSVLRTNVWFQHGNFKIYPNTYIVFLAESAQYRKGQPIEVSRRLLNLLKYTKVFSGTASIQAILDLLAQDVANKQSGVPIKGGAALITADELASFFVADPRLIPLLTDIWSPRVGDDVYEYHLRSQNSIIIKNLCVSMLAASNETFLRDVYDSRAVYGGLLGRTFMIKPDAARKANSLMTEGVSYDETHLLNSLKKIKLLQGRVTVEDDAKIAYNSWYTELYDKYKTHPDKTGVIQRMHTNVIKIAIIMAAAHYSLTITKHLFEQAILEVSSLKQNYELYVMSSGKSSLADIGAKLLAMMMDSPDHAVTRTDFLTKNFGDVMAEDLDKLIETLQQSEMISVGIRPPTYILYTMTKKCLNIMSKK